MGSVETESPSELCDSVVGITCEPEAADDGKAEISSSLESGAQEHVDTAAGLATEPRSTESVRLQEETGHESGDSTKETSKMSVDIVASGSQVDKAAAPKAAASASEQEPRIPETGVTSAVHSRRVAVAERQDAAVAGPAATHDACPATVGVGAASGLRAENVEPFVPRRSAHRRRDSLSGEIPMQGQPERYEARIHHHQQQQQLYGYDRETGNVSEAYYGRMYYRDQGRTTELQGRQVLVHTPGQGREPEWQISQTEGPRGTVYASDETYSFRSSILS